MNDNVIQLHKKQTNTVDTAIDSAKTMEFDTVIILGMKGDEIYMTHSKLDSRLKLSGALTFMQYDLWTNTYESD